MILANGKIYDSSKQDILLKELEAEINQTLAGNNLHREKVITAIHALGQKIADDEFQDLIREFLPENAEDYLDFVTQVMSEKCLNYRLSVELGEEFMETKDSEKSKDTMETKDSGNFMEIQPPYGISKAIVKYVPLGTLFHIAAGNMDGLPAFSVIDGLLTGNVNILKLPQADNGLTIEIFKALIELEPSLAPYIYVFDTPSSDISAMRKMADMADGIVVWGGDEAVRAVRTLATTGAKLIEWGHKLGFAYVSGYEDKAVELSALAKHIMVTKQLLCSSCQTIYVDTEEMEEVHRFCEEFLPFLEAAAGENPVREIGAVAEISLRRYAERLEGILRGDLEGEQSRITEGSEDKSQRTFQGNGCSITACTDSSLELSYMYGNVLVKPLPEKEIVNVLRKSKGYLQTVGLICTKEKREQLTDIFVRSGVNRVMTAGNMSVSFCGEAHDGEYPFRRYLRVVNIEVG